MKRFLALIAAFFVLCSSVSAVELDSSSSNEQTGEDVINSEAITEEIAKESPVANVSGQEVSSGSSDTEVSSGGSPIYVLESPASSDGVDYGDLTDIPVGATIDNITVTSVSPVEPSDTSGLKSALLGVLGSYDPVIVLRTILYGVVSVFGNTVGNLRFCFACRASYKIRKEKG